MDDPKSLLDSARYLLSQATQEGRSEEDVVDFAEEAIAEIERALRLSGLSRSQI